MQWEMFTGGSGMMMSLYGAVCCIIPHQKHTTSWRILFWSSLQKEQSKDKGKYNTFVCSFSFNPCKQSPFDRNKRKGGCWYVFFCVWPDPIQIQWNTGYPYDGGARDTSTVWRHHITELTITKLCLQKGPFPDSFTYLQTRHGFRSVLSNLEVGQNSTWGNKSPYL